MALQKITPFLWFDNQAEEAAALYVSVFPNSSLGAIRRYGESGPGPAGSAMTVQFQLDGLAFTALNGGPHFKFTEAVSFVVPCDTQEEIDHYWSKLSNGEGQCGWLKDRFGLSWQIVPSALDRLLGGAAQQSASVMKALMTMKKLDIVALQKAYDNPV